MRKLKNRKATSPVVETFGQRLDQFVRKLNAVESLNICVQTSIGAFAAQADPARWFGLIADAAEAARKDLDQYPERKLEDLLERILEHTEKASR